MSAVQQTAWFDLPATWPKVAPWVRAGLERPGVQATVEEIYDDCLARKSVLWLAVEDEPVACAVTQIMLDNRAKICQALIFGEHPDWSLFAPEVERMAKAEGCACVDVAFDGRRPAPKVPNYKFAYVIVQKEI